MVSLLYIFIPGQKPDRNGYFRKGNNSDEKIWADATYVKDAKVLPENEGKFVAVSGTPRMLEPVVDENVGVTLQSPKGYRLVETIEWDNSANEWRTKDNLSNLAVISDIAM